jgi:outer membrane protein with beta-barrel domain
MKKLFLSATALMLLLAISSSAQTEQGNLLLGGTAGFDVQFEDPDNILSISAFPNIGFFVQDNLAVGGQVGFGYAKRGDFTSTNFSILPFGRYYFGPDGGPKIFVQAMAGYITTKSKGDFYESTASGVTFGGGPGIAIFLNDHVAIEGILGLNRVGGDFDTTDFGLLFGVQAYLNGGK